MDILPTVLELAGIPTEAVLPSDYVLDGKSIVELITGKNTTSPHNETYFWREHTLYAVRQGSWKAHYFTRSGFESDPPVAHDPPLLFNIDWDMAERVNVSAASEADVITSINVAYQNHLASVVPGKSQYEAQDWSVVPCCQSALNVTALEEYLKDHEWSLALWEELGCVCPDEIPNN